MKRINSLILALIGLGLILPGMVSNTSITWATEPTAPSPTPSKPAPVAAPVPALDKSSKIARIGVGALGRIEPRSRVIRLSHDQGPEGARIETMMVEEGQDIRAGDTVAIFSNQRRRQAEVEIGTARVAALKARRSGIEAELADAKADYARKQPLLQSAAISRSTYDQAQARLRKATSELSSNDADVKSAEAELKLAQEKLQQSVIIAPINGTVLKIRARNGEYVGDSGVVDIADLDNIDVVAEVYENDVTRVHVGQTATIILPGQIKTYKATVREIGFLVQKNDMNDTDPLADRDTRVVEVRMTLAPDGANDLKHQIYRQVQVQMSPE